MQVKVLLNNCKQTITSLSLLVGTTVCAMDNGILVAENNFKGVSPYLGMAAILVM